jgi:hypothetical protein
MRKREMRCATAAGLGSEMERAGNAVLQMPLHTLSEIPAPGGLNEDEMKGVI